jgi:hypothetical protein
MTRQRRAPLVAAALLLAVATAALAAGTAYSRARHEAGLPPEDERTFWSAW